MELAKRGKMTEHTHAHVQREGDKRRANERSLPLRSFKANMCTKYETLIRPMSNFQFIFEQYWMCTCPLMTAIFVLNVCLPLKILGLRRAHDYMLQKANLENRSTWSFVKMRSKHYLKKIAIQSFVFFRCT